MSSAFLYHGSRQGLHRRLETNFDVECWTNHKKCSISVLFGSVLVLSGVSTMLLAMKVCNKRITN